MVQIELIRITIRRRRKMTGEKVDKKTKIERQRDKKTETDK